MTGNLRPVLTEEDYEWALGEVEQYFDTEPEPGSPDADRFNILVGLIEAYEGRHWTIDLPDPIDAIASVMASYGYTKTDLAQILGSASRASEVMKRRRPLNLRMIQELNKRWKIPAEVLIRPYHLERQDDHRLSA